MSIRFQRLLIIIISLILLSSSISLILLNSKKNIVFFYTPTELINHQVKINDQIRIGGIVKKNSLINNITGRNYFFVIADNENEIEIEFKGILPDLFQEQKGAVIEGILIKKNGIIASKVFAKHDENYMPSSIKKQLKKTNYWKQDY